MSPPFGAEHGRQARGGGMFQIRWGKLSEKAPLRWGNEPEKSQLGSRRGLAFKGVAFSALSCLAPGPGPPSRLRLQDLGDEPKHPFPLPDGARRQVLRCLPDQVNGLASFTLWPETVVGPRATVRLAKPQADRRRRRQ